jgi:hypothetical protein
VSRFWADGRDHRENHFKACSEKKAPEIMNLIDIEKRLLEWN